MGPKPFSSAVGASISRSWRYDYAMLLHTRRGWEEPRPAHCPHCGAELGAHQVLVGVAQCAGGTMHRTHTCRN
jgi:hypothetical protein